MNSKELELLFIIIGYMGVAICLAVIFGIDYALLFVFSFMLFWPLVKQFRPKG